MEEGLMKIYGLYCPNCQKEVKADPRYEDGQFYICSECGKPIGYRCTGCEQFFGSNHLMLHQDLYICKVCGIPQYGYTDWKRTQPK